MTAPETPSGPFEQSAHDDWNNEDHALPSDHHTDPGEATHSTVFEERRPGDTAELIIEARRRPVLVILEGQGSGGLFVLKKDAIVLGREVDTDVILKDGRVSRRHAKISWSNVGHEFEEPDCVLEDLNSRNGVFVNGKRVSRQRLADGDRIHLGATLLGFYIKDEKELNVDQKLLTMATTDSLTGLANRPFFEAEARREIDRSRRYRRPLSLLAIDIDLFKQINDTYGHAAGDAVLRQLARILLVTLREGDVVGRVGGEEFAALLPETNLVGARITAERLRDRVARHTFMHKDQAMSVTISVGVDEFKPRYETRAEFFEEADRALYKAKSEGRNRVCSGTPPDDGIEPNTDVFRRKP